MDKEIVITYEPDSRHKIGFFKTWVIMLRNIIRSKNMIFQLFKRDFFMSYRKSLLGIWWVFISPIIGIISWVFMNATGILAPGDVGIPYPAYVLLSTSIFGLFNGFYSAGKGTLSAGSGFIMQVHYPHEVLLIHQALMTISGFGVTFIINLIVLFSFGVIPHWKILFFPILIIPFFFLGAAFGLLFSVISAVSSEVSKAFDILLGLVIYITPVIYAADTMNPTLRQIINYNPLTYLVSAVRDIIIYGKSEYLVGYLIVSVVSLFLFMVSWRIFFVSEDIVIEKMIL